MADNPGHAAERPGAEEQRVRSLSTAARQRLYAAFAGRCAFQGCPYQTQLPDGIAILEIAHIVALTPGGPRYSPPAAPGQANDESNLILLCPTHHVLVDSNPSEYPAERLRGIRDRHLMMVTPPTPAPAPGKAVHDKSGASRLEHAIGIWESERQNSSEEFWQSLFSRQPELLAAATNGCAFALNAKCYVGGKAIDNHGGSIVDFLLQQKANAVLVEIKTPQARLLGSRYRSVYPPSPELAGGVVQVLTYRQSLQQELHSLARHSPSLSAVNPQAFLLIGDSEDEAFSPEQEESFELFRNSLKDIVIRTYDELFDGVRSLAAWMKPFPSGRAD
jgi:hypothetical protein